MLKLSFCNTQPRTSYCLILSGSYNNSKTESQNAPLYLFFRKYIVEYIDWHSNKFEAKSWKQAHNLCSSVGGHLPILRSREELEVFISIVKLSDSLPPIAALFLGLKSTNQVSMVFTVALRTCSVSVEKHIHY